jgi:Transposase IS4
MVDIFDFFMSSSVPVDGNVSDIDNDSDDTDGDLEVPCPNIVSYYNRYMGGVDLVDQLKGYYGIDRKSKRWWIRLFFHFVDLAVTNAYILYIHSYRNYTHPPMVYNPVDQLMFRCQLIDQLVNHYTSRKQHGRPVKTPVVSLVPSGHNIIRFASTGDCQGTL